MNRKLVSNALTGIDDELIRDALTYRVAEHSRAPERKTPMETKYTEKYRGASRRLISLALAACLVLALTVTAYALNLFGIRDLYANPNRGEMPQGAAELIETQAAAAESEGWSCRVTESYCDEDTVLVAVTVTAGDAYIVAPTGEDPNSPLWTIGLDEEGTLGDYAFGLGKKLLFVGASLDREALGLSSNGQQFESPSPQELVILVQAHKSVSAATIDTVCTVTALELGPEDLDRSFGPTDVQRVELPITLTEGKTELLGVYVPEDPDAIPGVHLGEITVSRTPLGISMRLSETPTDMDAFYNIMTARVEGLEFHGSDGGGFQDDGTFQAEFSQGRGELGDTLTLTFLDWDKQPIGTVTFVKK